MESKNSQVWQASLQLHFVKRGGKTLLINRQHIGPLRVQRPFYPESDSVCHVYVVHPPGGIVSGDELEISARLEPGSWGLITTPGATKIYRSNQKLASQSVQIQLEDNAVMEWLPQESILFDGAYSKTTVRVDADAKSHFLGWDLTCLGRPASGQNLHNCNIVNRFQIYRQGSPVLLENAHYLTGHPVLTADWGLRGCPVTGLFACTKSDAALVRKVREVTKASSEALFAVSELPGVLVCRYLGFHAEEAKSLFKKAWSILRPAVLNAAPITPRIWNT